MAESFDTQTFQSEIAQVLRALDASYQLQVTQLTQELQATVTTLKEQLLLQQSSLDRYSAHIKEQDKLISSLDTAIDELQNQINHIVAEVDRTKTIKINISPKSETEMLDVESEPSADVVPTLEPSVSLLETYMQTRGWQALKTFLEKSDASQERKKAALMLDKITTYLLLNSAEAQPDSLYLAVTVYALIQANVLDKLYSKAQERLISLLHEPLEGARFLNETASFQIDPKKKSLVTLLDFWPPDEASEFFGQANGPFLTNFVAHSSGLRALIDGIERSMITNPTPNAKVAFWTHTLAPAFKKLNQTTS